MSLNFQEANLMPLFTLKQLSFYPTNIHHAWDTKIKYDYTIQN